MDRDKLKRILAGVSLAGLLSVSPLACGQSS